MEMMTMAAVNPALQFMAPMDLAWIWRDLDDMTLSHWQQVSKKKSISTG